MASDAVLPAVIWFQNWNYETTGAVDNDDFPLDGAKFLILRVTIWSKVDDFYH